MRTLIVLMSICWLQGAELRVELSQAGKKVSPNLFGLFFEEINHAGDGGLYAELIRNRSFAEAVTLDAWGAVRTGASRVNLYFDTSMPLNSVKERSLRIEINSPGGERTGVSNEGYWGIAARQGESYEFSMYARGAAGFDGPLTVSLEGKDGAVYGQTQLAGLKTSWSRLTGSIQSKGTDPVARLVISANRSGTFWINMASLRPGMDIFRADLLQKLKDLKPGFVRFPGGTYVQGNDRETAFRWKNTVGDLETRAGHQNAPWVYWSTDSMGFHEYLLLCERLGAVPMDNAAVLRATADPHDGRIANRSGRFQGRPPSPGFVYLNIMQLISPSAALRYRSCQIKMNTPFAGFPFAESMLRAGENLPRSLIKPLTGRVSSRSPSDRDAMSATHAPCPVIRRRHA